MTNLLLRSMLFVPTYKKRFIENALRYDADAIILDLEDSVPKEFKEEARTIIREFIDKGSFVGKLVFVRLNPIESKLLFEDLKFVLHKDIDGFMLAKIYTNEDMIYYDKLFSQLENEHDLDEGHFKFAPLIETTSAVMDVYNIARATKRTIALCFGGEDFLNDLEGLHGEPPKAFNYPRASIALAARAAGILPIDTPYLKLDDSDGFIVEEKISFEMGYAGCLILHPIQISLAHQCFTPEDEEIRKSQEIVQAINEAELFGSGVAMLDGKMIGPPMRKRAEKVLKMMELINKKHEDK